MHTAPSSTGRQRSTSKRKSWWPGVSIRLMVLGSAPGGSSARGGQWKVMAADWMVMPFSRSRGRKSVTVSPWSTSGDRDQSCGRDLEWEERGKHKTGRRKKSIRPYRVDMRDDANVPDVAQFGIVCRVRLSRLAASAAPARVRETRDSSGRSGPSQQAQQLSLPGTARAAMGRGQHSNVDSLGTGQHAGSGAWQSEK
ncbi:hypothetical protein VTK73DRAFT_2184 [Phialemonium thermophilum]|uniref:Uncharacterized protein n=1 Tax=Phialemonium thermophilum TaxID=223376 RepID=A0ABR3VSF1_9PEZI